MLGVGVRFHTIDANAFKLPLLGVHVAGAATAPIVRSVSFLRECTEPPAVRLFPRIDLPPSGVSARTAKSHRETVRGRHLRGIRAPDEDLGIFFSWLKWNRARDQRPTDN
jgi:hypothetical protein